MEYRLLNIYLCTLHIGCCATDGMMCGPVFRVDHGPGLQVPVQEVPRLCAGQVEAVLSLQKVNDNVYYV